MGQTLGPFAKMIGVISIVVVIVMGCFIVGLVCSQVAEKTETIIVKN